MRSGGGVLCISAAQLLVGLVLLGLYEGYKTYYFNTFIPYIMHLPQNQTESVSEEQRVVLMENPMDFRYSIAVQLFGATTCCALLLLLRHILHPACAWSNDAVTVLQTSQLQNKVCCWLHSIAAGICIAAECVPAHGQLVLCD